MNNQVIGALVNAGLLRFCSVCNDWAQFVMTTSAAQTPQVRSDLSRLAWEANMIDEARLDAHLHEQWHREVDACERLARQLNDVP